MNFSNDKAIYIQMAERLCDEILSGQYKEDERIPSVREYAVLLQVNTNTAMKAYDQLARDEIIYNKRGLGYFVKAGAKEKIMDSRRKTFMEQVTSGVRPLLETIEDWCRDEKLGTKNGNAIGFAC